MRTSPLVLAAVLAATLPAAAGACSGDAWVDSRLVEINDYGMHNQGPFVDEIVTNYGAPRPVVVELLGTRHWSPGDVYYACAFAHSINRPCAEVADRYERNRAGGWGFVMGSYNVGYTSPQFVTFRGGFVNTYGRWGHPIVLGRNEHVVWQRGSIHGHVPQGHAYGYWEHHGHGHDHDHGHGDHDGDEHGHGHGHGHDKKHEPR